MKITRAYRVHTAFSAKFSEDKTHERKREKLSCFLLSIFQYNFGKERNIEIAIKGRNNPPKNATMIKVSPLCKKLPKPKIIKKQVKSQ